MRSSVGRKLCIDGAVWFIAALGIFLVPMPWLAGAVLGAAFHEVCHLFAIWLSGGRVLGMEIHAGGAVIETEPMTPGREVVCALAGPLGSFSLLTFTRCAPELAVCAGVQGVFNLLPIYPLDGGRALNALLQILFPGNGERIFGFIEKITILILLCIGVYWGNWVLFLSLIAAFKALWKKNSLQRMQSRSTIDLPFAKR